MKKNFLLFTFLFALTLGFVSCSNDDSGDKKEEVIETPKTVSIIGKWNLTEKKSGNKWVNVSEYKDFITFKENNTYVSKRNDLPEEGTYTYNTDTNIIDLKSSAPYDDEDIKIIEITDKTAEVEFFEPKHPQNKHRYKLVKE